MHSFVRAAKFVYICKRCHNVVAPPNAKGGNMNIRQMAQKQSFLQLFQSLKEEKRKSEKKRIMDEMVNVLCTYSCKKDDAVNALISRINHCNKSIGWGSSDFQDLYENEEMIYEITIKEIQLYLDNYLWHED